MENKVIPSEIREIVGEMPPLNKLDPNLGFNPESVSAEVRADLSEEDRADLSEEDRADLSEEDRASLVNYVRTATEDALQIPANSSDTRISVPTLDPSRFKWIELFPENISEINLDLLNISNHETPTSQH